MVKPEFPLPDPNQPLEILDVYDGLTIDAQCWLDERKYHQQRQNLHYRSLNQPGIVCGLGVRVMNPGEISPDAVYQDERWVEIQPGIAIDIEGNPIIIGKPEKYRIHNPTDNIEQNLRVVYLCVSYRQPQSGRGNNPSPTASPVLKAEQFAIAQQTEALEEGQVELCRIALNLGDFQLHAPEEVFYPQENELDFRYRRRATWRSNQQVKVGLLVSPKVNAIEDLDDSDRQTRENLSFLMKAVESLYPRMQGREEIDLLKATQFNSKYQFSSPSESQTWEYTVEDIYRNYNLIYLGASQEKRNFKDWEIAILKSYLEMGGMLWVEVRNSQPESLEKVTQRYKKIYHKKNSTSPPKFRKISNKHPIFKEPFLFAKFPENGTIELYQLNNIILIVGELSARWGQELSWSRSDIRTAHEFGINLLYYARCYWEQHRCHQWKNSKPI